MQIKQFRYFITTALLMVVCADLPAQDYRFSLAPGIGNSQFKLNESNLIADFTGLTGASSFNDSATAFGLMGGMRLDEYLSLEVDFLISGDISAREGGRTFKLFDVSTLAITLLLANQVSDRVNLFARLGVHMWDISESFGNLDTINSAVDLTYGLGADINLYGDRSRQMRIQWNRYEYDAIYIESSDTISLSLLFLLGAE